MATGRYRVRVEVRLRPAIYDPQGEAIRRALAGAGAGEVLSVRQGKSFDLEIAAASAAAAKERATEIARRVLASPVLEDFAVAVQSGGDRTPDRVPDRASPGSES